MQRLVLWLMLTVFPAALPAAVLVTQDFQSGSPPAGWTRSQNTPSAGFEFGFDLGSEYFPIPSHTRYAASNDDKHGSGNLADRDRLITPSFSLVGVNGARLLFKYFHRDTYLSTASIEASTDGGVTWNQITSLSPTESWESLMLTLPPYLLGQATVKLAFRHNDGGGWADGLAIDDVLIETVPPRDVALLGLAGSSSFTLIGTQLIGIRVQNVGAETVTSLGLSYQVQGSAAQSATIDGLSIAPGAVAELMHPVPYSPPAAGNYPINLGVLLVNGQTDLSASNNNVADVLRVMSKFPAKRVVLEQHTGSWCQFCPDGTVYWNALRAEPDVIAVSIHTSDAMSTADGQIVQQTYISAYPTGTIDRTTQGLDRSLWPQKVADRRQEVVTAAVEVVAIDYAPADRMLSATVRANFYGDDAGDMRLNLWVVEDGVIGFGSSYDQTNFYNTVFGHPYFGAGNPILGFVHDGVVRAMLGGAWGAPQSVPSTMFAGSSAEWTFDLQLPAEINPAQVRLVGLLQRYDVNLNQRQIVNADQAFLTPLFGSGFE